MTSGGREKPQTAQLHAEFHNINDKMSQLLRMEEKMDPALLHHLPVTVSEQVKPILPPWTHSMGQGNICAFLLCALFGLSYLE